MGADWIAAGRETVALELAALGVEAQTDPRNVTLPGVLVDVPPAPAKAGGHRRTATIPVWVLVPALDADHLPYLTGTTATIVDGLRAPTLTAYLDTWGARPVPGYRIDVPVTITTDPTPEG